MLNLASNLVKIDFELWAISRPNPLFCGRLHGFSWKAVLSESYLTIKNADSSETLEFCCPITGLQWAWVAVKLRFNPWRYELCKTCSSHKSRISDILSKSRFSTRYFSTTKCIQGKPLSSFNNLYAVVKNPGGCFTTFPPGKKIVSSAKSARSAHFH